MSRHQGIMSCYDIRAAARKLLKGHWYKFFVLMLIFAFASNFFSLNSLTCYVLGDASSQNASILVAHTSGLSWNGELPYPAFPKTPSNSYILEDFISTTASVRNYSLNDFFRTVTSDDGFFGVLVSLPSDFWIVLMFLSLATMLLPMMSYGLSVNFKRRIHGEKPTAKALFCWKILPKCILADAILYGPAFLLQSLIKDPSASVFAIVICYIVILLCFLLEFMWSMRYYIWIDSPDMDLIAVLRESRLRMRGHKFRLFSLQLSFIGWNLLYSVGVAVINAIANTLGVPGIIPIALTLCGYVWLSIYQQMSEMIFFDNICHPSMVDTGDDEDTVSPAESGSIHIRSTNESVAWSILSSHKYSRQAIKDDGIWEEYQALDINPIVEIEWLKKYARFMCDEYTQNPGVLDDILRYASEYGDTFSITRVVNTLGRYVDQESHPAEVLLEHCEKLVCTINSHSFADHKKFILEKKELISDMGDRLEFRLNKSDPNGNWRDVLAVVRAGCIE